MFIVIEGGDGVGKTTLINNLKVARSEYVFTKEPNFNDATSKIRAIIDEGGLSTEAVAYLFGACRAEDTRKVIMPALSVGKTVIADRYVYSSIVYQGLVGGMGVEEVRALNKWAMIEPDMVIILRGKSFKDASENWLDNIGQGAEVGRAFELLAENDSKLFKMVNVTGKTPKDILREVLDIIDGEICE